MFSPEDIYSIVDGIFPFRTREDWDNSGLLVNCGQMSSKLLICLDVTKEAVAAAKKCGAKIILSHHPVIFEPLRQIDGGVIQLLVKEGISVISAHTNFDNYRCGTSYAARKSLDLDFTPADGWGLTGKLCDPAKPADFAKKCRDVFGSASYADGGREFKKIYICPGSGGGEKQNVLDSGAGCFLTGECRYHDSLDLVQAGVTVVTTGHDAIEKVSLPYMKSAIAPQVGDDNIEIFLRETLFRGV